jgi:hypothetical protein
MQLGLDTNFDFFPRTAGIGVFLIVVQSSVECRLIGVGQFASIQPNLAEKFIQFGLNLREFVRLQLGQFSNDFGFAHKPYCTFRP